jgi:hypothetical protein
VCGNGGKDGNGGKVARMVRGGNWPSGKRGDSVNSWENGNRDK